MEKTNGCTESPGFNSAVAPAESNFLSAGQPRHSTPDFTREADLDFLDHIHREEFDQPDLPWES